MHNKLMLACASALALAALALAPGASASPVLAEGGTPLAVGASVTGKNTGNYELTGMFGLQCEVFHLRGSVLKNTGTEFEVTVPAGGITLSNSGGSLCSSLVGATTYKLTSELCLTNVPKTDELTITGCGANPITFDMTVGGATCRYSAAAWKGSFTTNATPATMRFAGHKVTEEEPRLFFCPDEGAVDVDFDLYTTDGTAVAIS